MHASNRQQAPSNFSELQSLEPVLSRVLNAGDAVGLSAHELLHAGPPLTDPQNPPPVLMSAAVMTALHEGWAHSEADAEKLVRDGRIQWRCAQDLGCLAPLAATVSQTTPLFEVNDPSQQLASRYTMVSPVRGADTRMGNRDPDLPARLQQRDQEVAPRWQEWLATKGPLPLWPIAKAGLAGGDDLHYGTAAASQSLGAALIPAVDVDWAKAIAETPTYFLTLWMAACAMLLEASGKGPCKTAVIRAGGNGEFFGLALAQNSQSWASVAASPPLGPRLPGAEDVPACPAIGDSAVIDFAGFGAQSLPSAAAAREAFLAADVLPADYADIAGRIGLTELAGLSGRRRCGVDAQAVLDRKSPPLVALAMLDLTGRQGLLGRGVYRPDISLFEKALIA